MLKEVQLCRIQTILKMYCHFAQVHKNHMDSQLTQSISSGETPRKRLVQQVFNPVSTY